VAAVTAESRDLESVMSAADTACYLAKENGRNQVQVYCEEDEEVSSRHTEMGMVSRITRAVEDNRFFVHCQRVMALDGEATEYLELLLRMRDEQGRVVPPMAFIPAAERYHLMGTIDRWVVAKALRCLGRLHASPSGQLPRFGLNLSGMSLGDAAFADFVMQHLEESGAPAAAVCFEITETAAISNLGRAARFIRRFRDLGCRFALDDFGTGLTSFAYLGRYPWTTSRSTVRSCGAPGTIPWTTRWSTRSSGSRAPWGRAPSRRAWNRPRASHACVPSASTSARATRSTCPSPTASSRVAWTTRPRRAVRCTRPEGRALQFSALKTTSVQ